MAIIKDGKIKGKIGNYIYRVVDGQEIVQAYAAKPKQSANTKLASAQFIRAAKTGSKVYRQAKSFALDFARPKVYRDIVSNLRGSAYAEIGDKTDLQSDWAIVPNSNPMPINKDALLEDYFKINPEVIFSETAFTVHIPKLMDITKGRQPKGSNYLELFVSIYHTHRDMTYELSRHQSERIPIVEGFEEQNVTLPLEWMENIDKNGIVYVCFGLSFFEQANSRTQINESRYNPSAILGMWHKNVK